MYRFAALRLEIPEKKIVHPRKFGAIALSYSPRVRVRAMVKLSAAFFHDESSITIGGVRKCNSANHFISKLSYER